MVLMIILLCRIENQRITSLRGKRKAKLNTLSSFQLYEKQAILPAIHKREHIQLLHNHNSNSIEITNRTDKVLDVLGDVGGVSNHVSYKDRKAYKAVKHPCIVETPCLLLSRYTLIELHFLLYPTLECSTKGRNE